eukprot:XP_019924729.1 PREDICTED: ribosomal protein S6 kinase alpha-3-like [Crassostrea gigas]
MPLAHLADPWKRMEVAQDTEAASTEDMLVDDQNDNDLDREINVANMMKDGERVEPKDFELLKVLGQGSFGKACTCLVSDFKGGSQVQKA